MKKTSIPTETFDEFLEIIERGLSPRPQDDPSIAREQAASALISLRSYSPTKVEENVLTQFLNAEFSVSILMDETPSVCVYSKGRCIASVLIVQPRQCAPILAGSVILALNYVHDHLKNPVFRAEWEAALDHAVENKENILFNDKPVLWDDWKEFFSDKPALYADLYEDDRRH